MTNVTPIEIVCVALTFALYASQEGICSVVGKFALFLSGL